MNKIIVLIFFSVLHGKGISQTLPQIDSINISKVNFVFTHKVCYIGEPLSTLLHDLNITYKLGTPDYESVRNRWLGSAYYYNFCILLPCKPGIQLRGLKISIEKKVIIDLREYHTLASRDLWDSKMIPLLNREIITDINKCW